MQIATWNVNGLRARLDFVLHWLRERRPDVVGLQELKLQDAQFPHECFEALGYRALTHGQKAWNGVAILSREPAESVERGLAGQDERGARLITARVAGLEFTTVYCPNGKSVTHPEFPDKLAWLDALQAWAQRARDGRAGVLCGDFNLCPGPLDTWNEALCAGQIFHTEAERERFRGILQAGWIDLFRSLQPESQAFSWWDYRGGAFHKNEGLRIDLVLGTAPVAARMKDARIDRDYRKKKDGLTPSDHAPVLVELS